MFVYLGKDIKAKLFYPDIDEIIFNDPATIIKWSNGQKTVVKCAEGDEYDPFIGALLCVAKRAMGDNYRKNINKIYEAVKNDNEETITQVEESLYGRFDDKTVRQIEEYFMELTTEEFCNIGFDIRSKNIPDKLANILGMPTYLILHFQHLPNDIANRTIVPLCRIWNREAKDRGLDEY